MREYIDFLVNNGLRKPKDDAVFEAFLVPLAIGGNRNADNRVFLTAKEWADASMILMRFFSTCTARKPEISHGRLVIKMLPKLNLPECDAGPLRNVCLRALEHSAGVLRPVRLYKKDGKEAFGTYRELEVQTGLEYNQVRDLVKGRRRYAAGWSASKEEAEKGPLKVGRKRKVEGVDFESTGTPFF